MYNVNIHISMKNESLFVFLCCCSCYTKKSFDRFHYFLLLFSLGVKEKQY